MPKLAFDNGKLDRKKSVEIQKILGSSEKSFDKKLDIVRKYDAQFAMLFGDKFGKFLLPHLLKFIARYSKKGMVYLRN